MNGVKHVYTLDGTKILRETWDDNEIIPLYDNEDGVCGIQYNGEAFYFHKNLQGDVIEIVDKDAKTVARYTYDAWGACTIIQDSSDCNIASINPYRYRSYYYDEETGMYYLQSRYYDPDVGRFINEDAIRFLGVGGTFAGYNLFTYCDNDPTDNSDELGWGPWTPMLTLADYRTIHNKVADLVAWEIGFWRASREVYVTGAKGRGFLDVYDTISNEYYEVKSKGAAYKASTDRQMKKYDVAKPPLSWRGYVKRGNKNVSGSFYYGAWKVSYALKTAGLVVYTPTWKRERFKVGAVFSLVAIGLVAFGLFAMGGAAAPLFSLLFI